MEATGMEVEEDSTPTSSNHMLKRFGLKNSIQTNFGEDYVFQVAARFDYFRLISSNFRDLFVL